MSDTKTFYLGTLLTVVTGRLLTSSKDSNSNGIGDLYQLLGWMTDDEPFTHQLGRFSKECEPWLLRWFPDLAKANDHLDRLDFLLKSAKENGGKLEYVVSDWVARCSTDWGMKDKYEVPKIPRDDHEHKDPYDELVAMRGTDEEVVIID